MQELTTHANVVTGDALGEPFVVSFSRRELEALRDSGDPAQLWLELEQEGNDGTKRLAIDLTTSDVERLLEHPNGDDLLVALDSYALNGLFDDAEVEAHGLRSALAIAVIAAAAAAPAGLAATPQATNPAATAQKAATAQATAQSTAQSTAQRVSPAAQAQVSKAAAQAQVSRTAARPQISNAATRAQVSKTLILKANGISLFRTANR
jgi:hypothetical protein